VRRTSPLRDGIFPASGGIAAVRSGEMLHHDSVTADTGATTQRKYHRGDLHARDVATDRTGRMGGHHVPGPTLGTGVAAPLGQLVEAKTVRVLDAVVVHKAADGTVTEGELADETSAFDPVEGEVLELVSHADLRAVAERLANDTTTLVLVWENLWAAGFADAVRAHGGSLLAHDRVSPDDVARALAAEVAGAPADGSGA